MSPPMPVFILGDFNARHKTWDPTIARTKQPYTMGKWVYKRLVGPTAQPLCRSLPRLTLLNNQYTTSRHVPTRPDANTVIDLAMTTHPQMVDSMHVISDAVIGSDHLPIVLCLAEANTTTGTATQHHTPAVTAPPIVDYESKYDEVTEEKHDAPQPFIVRTSTIPGAGYGLFANRPFKKGEMIVEYTGEVIDEATKVKRYPKNEGEYVMRVMHNMYIDAVDPASSSIGRYINSSGGGYNNAKINPYHRNGAHRMNIGATRNIATGDEILMPYGSAFHNTRAPPPPNTHSRPNPNRVHSPKTPSDTWEVHMLPPSKSKDDYRVRWRINDKVDWKLLARHLEAPLAEWSKD
jgi:hypothetical protein